MPDQNKIIVMDLNNNNVKKFTKEMPSHGMIFIAFLADWCGHCRHFKPEWEKIKSHLKKNADGSGHVITTNDKHMRELPCKLPSGFPTMSLYKGNKHIKDYDGGRNMPEILQFIKQHLTKHKKKSHKSKKHSSRKHKSRKHKSRKHKSRKHSSRKHKSRKHSSRKHKKHVYAGSTDTSCNVMLDCIEKIQPNGPLEPGHYVCVHNNCERITFGALPALLASPLSHSSTQTGGKKKSKRHKFKRRRARRAQRTRRTRRARRAQRR